MSPPVAKGFMPYGLQHEQEDIAPVLLHYEEYESLRLCDYDGLTHQEASFAMGISRPTFTRIYAVARQKVAMALAEARQLRIEGGKIYYDSEWHICRNCGCYFNNPDKEETVVKCALCGSSDIDSENDTIPSGNSECVEYRVCEHCGAVVNQQLFTIEGYYTCPACKHQHHHCRRKHNNY